MIDDQHHLSIDLLLDQGAIDPKTLHKRAAQLTRRRILLAAMKSFARKGYQVATIREIAADAGVTMGAVYHHFKDKKELLMSANRLRQVRSWELLRDAVANDGDLFEALRGSLREQFHFLATDAVLRGVTREYMGMALTDKEVNEMHNAHDAEFRDLVTSELERRYPKLSEEKRAALVQTLFVSLEGLFTSLVVESPVVANPEGILDALIDSFRDAVEKWSMNL
jgi:AcrR family transcriptional regulator